MPSKDKEKQRIWSKNHYYRNKSMYAECGKTRMESRTVSNQGKGK